MVQKVIEEYEDFFGRELGTFPETIHLETEDDASPLIIPTRRVPAGLKSKLKQE